MKKVIKLVISIFILILFFELIAFIFKTHHEITYNIKEKNETYKELSFNWDNRLAIYME